MSDFEKMRGEARNVNAEWAILKELAGSDMSQLSWSAEFERPGEEREKYRALGQKLLRMINRMPDNPAPQEKASRLDRIHRIAEGVGIGDDLQEALERGKNPAFAETVGRETFPDGAELTSDETERMEQLRRKVIDLTEAEPGALAEKFPSRNYLFHGTVVSKIEKIFQTGGLKNGVALAEDDPEISAMNLNSGFEGISWSLNRIDTLPGTRGHIAGFLAAPEDVLSEDEQFVIPSRPAPYEVLQVSEGLTPEETYFWKTQAETWGDGSASFGEKNNVDSNFVWLRAYKPDSKFFTSSVYGYKGSLAAEDLRKYFKIDEQRRVIWDEDLYQKFEVPPALPYIQSIIDRGMFKQVPEYADLDTVEKVLARTRNDDGLLMTLLATGRNEGKPANEAFDKALEAAKAVRIRPEEMYFVTSHKDLEDWLKVMARTGVEPKGILLYDDEQVIFENFASKYAGNHDALSEEIGRAIDVRSDFWQTKIGMDPEKLPRSGNAGQVLLESAVRRDRVIRVKDGKLEVVAV